MFENLCAHDTFIYPERQRIAIHKKYKNVNLNVFFHHLCNEVYVAAKHVANCDWKSCSLG